MKPHLFVFVTATFVLTALATQTGRLDFDFAKIVDTSTAIPDVGGTFDYLGFPARWLPGRF